MAIYYSDGSNSTAGRQVQLVKGTTGTYFRVGVIEGPIFSSTENPPMFMSTIDTSFVATVLS